MAQGDEIEDKEMVFTCAESFWRTDSVVIVG